MQKRQVALAVYKNFESVRESNLFMCSVKNTNHRKVHSEKTTFELPFSFGQRLTSDYEPIFLANISNILSRM
jgi:hypothetical protein